MEKMLMIYGIATLAGAVIFLLLNKERPPTPPCPPGHDERIGVFAGMKHIFKQRDMIYLLIIFFIVLGIFNAVTTWIEQIISPRGFTITQAGIAGALMMIGGIVGASTLPPLSDKIRKRKPFLVLAMIGIIPGLVGLALVGNYWLLLTSSFIFGFFIMAGRADRLPVRRRDMLSRARGDLSGNASPCGTDFRYTLHLRHGCRNRRRSIENAGDGRFPRARAGVYLYRPETQGV